MAERDTSLDNLTDENLVDLLGLRPDLIEARQEAHAEPKTKRPKRDAKREMEPFVLVLVRELHAGARALDSADELLVWLYILRERRVRQALGQPETFAVTNAGVASWGIHKNTKARAVLKLATAGLIRVERDGHRSPRVTLCGPC